MRSLASIQEISKLTPIEGADKIETATVLGWQCVVKKGEFKVGDYCVYCEVDSLMPDRPEFEFLRARKFRIKTIKLKGQISQGICFPLDILPSMKRYNIGDDVTKLLGIEKWEPYKSNPKLKSQKRKYIYYKWVPIWLMKLAKKSSILRFFVTTKGFDKTFPSLIPKTDETRVQILQPLLDKYKGTICEITEKLDGSSITIYLINNKFGVCSRNVDLYKNPENKYWKWVIENNVEERLRKYGNNIALQGELIGEGIQGNKYHLHNHEVYFFNAYSIKENRYATPSELTTLCSELNLKKVPVINEKYILNNNIEELIKMSIDKSVLRNTQREGIVIRPISEDLRDNSLNCKLPANRVSFKVINPEFLLKYNL